MNPNPALVIFFLIPAANIINILMPFYPVTRTITSKLKKASQLCKFLLFDTFSIECSNAYYLY